MKKNFDSPGDRIAHIANFAKSLQACNRIPVFPEENIVEIRRYTGEDGVQRELIIVDRVASALPGPGCENTTRTHRLRGKTLRGVIHGLRNGYGYGRGVITDRKLLRYE